MAESTSERPVTARDRILKGAREVFDATPYEQVRVEDILQAAGISRPTFYRLFRNKEEVFVEVSDEHVPKTRTVRERVLEGCREAFGQLGYRATRVEDILAAAGVSRPTFYRIFTSKQHAYEELDAQAVRYVLDAMRRAIQDDPEWREHLDRVIDSYMDWRISLGLPYLGAEPDAEPPGLRTVRGELLGEAGEAAQRFAALLCALESLCGTWSSKPDASAMAMRKRIALETAVAMLEAARRGE